MAFVADASIALAWYFKDEATKRTEALRDSLQFEELYVPSHWALEVTNALTAAWRRGRVSGQELRFLLTDLRALPSEVDRHTDQMAWSSIVDLAETHNLTTYDAAYLELAARRSVPLATLDKALAAAAEVSGVQILT
jgi:predicted nucleic acid-binding protein